MDIKLFSETSNEDLYNKTVEHHFSIKALELEVSLLKAEIENLKSKKRFF